MPKPRGREHTSLTETAQIVVRELQKLPNIKMIAPGEIRTTSNKGSGKRFVTCVFTSAGMELLISGQSVQKVAIHTDVPQAIFSELIASKKLKAFTVKKRERKPAE